MIVAADITLHLADRFPTGTKVEVFPAALVGEPWRSREKRAPHGLDPVASATVDKFGRLLLDELPVGHYVATAEVDGERRYVRFGSP